MTYDEFAETYQSEVAVIQNNTLTINGLRAEELIRQHRHHSISFFNDHLDALKVLGEQGSDAAKSKKLLQLYDSLLFQIASYFENEEGDSSFRDLLTSAMKDLTKNI